MYDTAKRVELVKTRVREKCRKEAKRGIYRLSVLCVVLFGSLVGTMGGATGFGQPAMYGTSGSMLLYEDAGGYALVGVIAFSAAVVITVLCTRYKEKSKRNAHPHTEEKTVE